MSVEEANSSNLRREIFSGLVLNRFLVHSLSLESVVVVVVELLRERDEST